MPIRKFLSYMDINQSIKIYFMSNRNITVYTLQCMLALKRLPEKHTLIKLAAQINKRTQILIQTGRDMPVWHKFWEILFIDFPNMCTKLNST